MNSDQLLVIKEVFKSKILQLKGTAFEDFFVNVMKKKDPGFRPVKPHGRNGDKKNDGFNDKRGIYYQIYSPESPSDKISDAIKKCKTDFAGLKDYWNSTCTIKEFYFVFNDKYDGTYPEVETTLMEIKDNNKELVECRPLYAHHLQEIFFSLKDDDIYEVISYIPNIDNIGKVDYLAMNEVVEYLVNNEKDYHFEDNYVVPDFENKIKFNNLSDQIKHLLTQGSYQNSVISDYFSKHNNFEKSKLKEIFLDLYNKGKKAFTKEENTDNLIFFYILHEAAPPGEKRIHDAVLVLMAYFFESCDIYEEPH